VNLHLGPDDLVAALSAELAEVTRPDPPPPIGTASASTTG
jgi:hypothetical protein